VNRVLVAHLDRLEDHMKTETACRLLGLSRSSVYRWRAPQVYGPARPPGAGAQSAALTADQTQQVLAVLNSDRFADKSPTQVWAILLDEGIYLCSVSSMYRILHAHNEVRERRRQATHPPRSIPELLATGPDQVWSWDITKLRGPVTGVWLCAYVLIDIFSRKIIHAEVHPRELELLAKDFLAAAVTANAGVAPRYVHSDNGSPMVAKTVTQLLTDLSITASRSRPHVSNDNPYSEAWNKTLKYAPVFPERFGCLADARDFLTRFVHYYNPEHRHSGIGLYTPASLHDGTWTTVRDHRQRVLNAAYQTHPQRFRSGPPQAPSPPTQAWINRPTITTTTTTEIHTGDAA
jgi:transposase InsO family protein